MLSKKQLKILAKCESCFVCGDCEIEDSSMDCTGEAAKTALAYRKILERYEEEWRTGYEINFGKGEIPKEETDYWELVALLKESEGLG